MKKIWLIVILFAFLLVITISGCSDNYQYRVAYVEKARENLERADYFQSQVDSQFHKIDRENANREIVNKHARRILDDSNRAQGSVQNAINNIEDAKLSTNDFQLRNYYEMRINAYKVKNDMAKKSSSFARDIKKSSGDKQKTEKIITNYLKTRAKQKEIFLQLMKKADDYMELKRV